MLARSYNDVRQCQGQTKTYCRTIAVFFHSLALHQHHSAHSTKCDFLDKTVPNCILSRMRGVQKTFFETLACCSCHVSRWQQQCSVLLQRSYILCHYIAAPAAAAVCFSRNDKRRLFTFGETAREMQSHCDTPH
jgi:hypothetical protein